MSLTPSLPKPLWLDRCASRLGALLPAIGHAEAWQFAEAAFEEGADLSPEEAADIFAQELPPFELGAPE